MTAFEHFSVVCLQCGKPCIGASCPHACGGSANITRRLVRAERSPTLEPIAHECAACGAKTIHDIVGGHFEVCRACGFANRGRPVSKPA